MKRLIILCAVAIVQCLPSLAQQYILDMISPSFDTTQVAHAVIDTVPLEPGQNISFAPQVAQPANSIGYTLDKTRIVGEVPYNLGTSISGQVELTIGKREN